MYHKSGRRLWELAKSSSVRWISYSLSAVLQSLGLAEGIREVCTWIQSLFLWCFHCARSCLKNSPQLRCLRSVSRNCIMLFISWIMRSEESGAKTLQILDYLPRTCGSFGR